MLIEAASIKLSASKIPGEKVSENRFMTVRKSFLTRKV